MQNIGNTATLASTMLDTAISRAEDWKGQVTPEETVKIRTADWDAVRSAARETSAVIGSLYAEPERYHSLEIKELDLAAMLRSRSSKCLYFHKSETSSYVNDRARALESRAIFGCNTNLPTC